MDNAQPTTNIESVHVTHEISFSSHWEAFFLACCFVLASRALVRTRDTAALLTSVGFLFVIAKYAIGYVLYLNPDFVTRYPAFITGHMSIGPVGLALVACGLYKQYFGKPPLSDIELK